jgi:hypothetical protein
VKNKNSIFFPNIQRGNGGGCKGGSFGRPTDLISDAAF